MRVKGKEIYIIAAVVAVVLIVAWYFLLLSPTRTKIADTDDQIATQTTSLNGLKAEVARLEEYKKAAPQSRAEIVSLGKMLPGTEGVPSLIIELGQTAEASGVDMVNLSPGTVQVGTPFGIQLITLQVEGTYFDVEDFMYRLENYVSIRNADVRVTGRLLQVTSAAITGGSSENGSSTSSPKLQASVTLNAYLWGGPAAVATGGAQ